MKSADCSRVHASSTSMEKSTVAVAAAAVIVAYATTIAAATATAAIATAGTTAAALAAPATLTATEISTYTTLSTLTPPETSSCTNRKRWMVLTASKTFTNAPFLNSVVEIANRSRTSANKAFHKTKSLSLQQGYGSSPITSQTFVHKGC